METQNKETVPAPKPKREHKWTDKRREAFERCRKARQESLQKMSDLKKQGKEKKVTEAKRIRDLVKNTTKIKAILEMLEGEEEESKPKAVAKKEEPKRARSPSPPKSEEPKRKKVAPPPPESESEEEAPPPRKTTQKPSSPKQILFYKPQPKPKTSPTVQPPKPSSNYNPPPQYEPHSRPQAPVQSSVPSLVFL